MTKKEVRTRSQVGVELLLVIAIITIIAVLLLPYINERKEYKDEIAEELRLNSECNKIVDSIAAVYTNGEGSKVDFRIYNKIQVFNKTVYVDNSTSCNIPFVLNGSTSIIEDQIKIENVNGEVVVS